MFIVINQQSYQITLPTLRGIYNVHVTGSVCAGIFIVYLLSTYFD